MERPENLLKRLIVTERVLMTPGITKLDPRIRAAMTLPLLPANNPQLQRVFKDIVEGIRYIFQTTNHYSFAINGPISLAFETAISNILLEGQTIMVVIHGVQGERMAKASRALDFKILRLKVANPGDLIDKVTIKNALETHKPKILFLCHGDDSVGTLQPLRGIGTICHENDCLFMVDVSSTICCAPFNADQMEIDVIIASTEYALGLSPGLSLISFNTKSVNLVKEKKDRIKSVCYSMNFDLLTQSWGLSDDTPKYTPITPPISLLYALRESLSMIVEETLDKIIVRHMKMSVTAQTEFTKMGLEFLVSDDSKRLSSVVVLLVPKSIRRELITEYMAKHYDIEISEGLSPIDKVWRIGIMGPNANRHSVKLLISVFREAIEKAQKSSSKNTSLSSPSTISDI